MATDLPLPILFCVKAINPESWYGQGLALYRLERHTEAIAALNQVLHLRAQYSLALVRRGLTYQQLEQPEAARADFERVLEMQAASAEDWRAKADCANGAASRCRN